MAVVAPSPAPDTSSECDHYQTAATTLSTTYLPLSCPPTLWGTGALREHHFAPSPSYFVLI